MLDRAEAEEAYRKRIKLYKRANRSITATLADLVDDLGGTYGVRHGLTVDGEPKPFDSFYRKATAKYECATVDEAFDRVRDLARVRVVCDTLDDCYRLIELLDGQESLHVDERATQDFIAEPRPWGYRAIHLEVVVNVSKDGTPIGVPVEVQLRTVLQEAWGNYTHEAFYHGRDVPEPVKTLMCELGELLYWADKHAALLVRETASMKQTTDEVAQSDGSVN